jgi:hypothetical protein
MKNKIPKDAFDYYVELGDGRSYQAVADHFLVSKRSVVKKAGREKWTEQLAEMNRISRQKTREKLQESHEERDFRHWTMVRAIAGRAAIGLKEFPLTSGMEAIKAAEVAIKLERLLAGDPNERSAIDIQEITKQEIRTLLTTKPVGADGPDEY